MNDGTERRGAASDLTRGKIGSIEELAAIAAEARRKGGKIVLAHGVFDLLHMGHVRHLKAAKQHGSHLMVTVTADEHVNKGPDRPVFSDHLRAEMLAALEMVDFVAINHAPSAEPAIRAIRPDVYVKGSDYRETAADVTGKIADERAAVEAHGGRIVFTDELTFSSSAIINRHLDVYEPSLRAYLDRQREGHALSRVLGLLDGIADAKVLFVGEAIVDEYKYVAPMGKSQKENIIATRFRDRELYAGGTVAAAKHAANFCARVDAVCLLGADESFEDFIRESAAGKVGLTFVHREGAGTVRKTRYVDPNFLRKLFEVYDFDDAPIPQKLQDRLNGILGERIGDYDVVVVSDFGHGMIQPSTIDVLTRESRFLAVNAQTNSANLGFNLVTKYPRAHYVCVDAPEARLAVADQFVDLETIASQLLPRRMKCERMILTHGNRGCVAFGRDEGLARVPAFTQQVVDTIGAGDAFLAVTAPLVAAGASMADAALIGNAVGAIMVGIVGHRQSVERAPLIKYLTALLA